MTASERIREARSNETRNCDVCGEVLTADEIRQLDADTDFISHHGHLVRSIKAGSMWNLRTLAECLLETPKGAPINEGLARDLARAALEAASRD